MIGSSFQFYSISDQPVKYYQLLDVVLNNFHTKEVALLFLFLFHRDPAIVHNNSNRCRLLSKYKDGVGGN